MAGGADAVVRDEIGEAHLSRTYTPPVAGARKRILRQLRDLGIDIEAVVIDDRPSPDALSEAVAALRKIAKAMAGPSKAVFPSAPTPERRTKGDKIVEIELQPGRAPAHAVIWPVDQVRQTVAMTDEEYQAAERFRASFYTLHRSQGVGSYGEATSRGTANRLELTERQQTAGAEYDFARHMLTREQRQCAFNFILEMPGYDGGSVMSWVGFGTFWTGCTQPDRARAYAQALLRSTCAQLARAYHRLDAENRSAQMANRRAG